MKVLCLGDVVGRPGMDFVCKEIAKVKRDMGVDYVVVNAENANDSGVGLTMAEAEDLLQHADVLTTGNHSFRRADEDFFLQNESILCPANFPYIPAQAGCCMLDTGRLGILRVINLAGTAFMEPLNSPFEAVDALLAKSEARFTIVDFHAESTAEKKALGFYLDGKVSAIFGTHTHVQTADEQILPKGTGFISDAGMCGPIVGVLGVQPEASIMRQRTHRPVRFSVAEGPCMMNGVVFTMDDASGLCVGVERVDWRGGTPP